MDNENKVLNTETPTTSFTGEKTKKCKHCQTEISAKAKICPNCKKRQKPSGCLTLILAFVIIGVVGSIIGGGDDTPKKVETTTNQSADSSKSTDNKDISDTTDTSENNDTSTEESSNTSEELVFGLGESAEYNDVIVTFTDVKESQGSQFTAPSDGNVFVLLYFEFANNSSKELAISSIASFNAYQDGYSTNLSFQALLEDSSSQQLDGSIAPGKKMKGFVGYEVPADYSEMEVQVTPDFWSGKDIVFKYTK